LTTFSRCSELQLRPLRCLLYPFHQYVVEGKAVTYSATWMPDGNVDARLVQFPLDRIFQRDKGMGCAVASRIALSSV